MSLVKDFSAASLVGGLALVLASCAGVKNVQTVKSADFTGTPRNIVAVQANGDPFSDSVKDAFRIRMAQCGVAMQFVPAPPPGRSINAPGADAMLTFTELGKETTTVSTRYGAVVDNYPDMYREEFALFDLKSRKDVWKGRGDFTTKEKSRDSIFKGSPGEAWSQTLLDLMKKDGLITDCDPAKLPAAAAVTTAAAVPPAGGASNISFGVGGKSYAKADDALAALRVLAGQKVAAATPTGLTVYDSLLVVIPTPEEIANASIKITGPSNLEDFNRYIVGSRQIQIDSYVQAFRKTGMFKSVTTAQSNELKPGEFRGSQYKLWFAKTEPKGAGSWTLATAKGTQQSFQMAASDDKGDVQAMLAKVQAAIDQMPR